MAYFVLFGGLVISALLAIAGGFFEFMKLNKMQDEEIYQLKREIYRLNDRIKTMERKGGAVKVYNASRKRWEYHDQPIAE